MDELNAVAPATPVPAPIIVPTRLLPVPRWLAIVQALAVSGIPTQLIIVLVLWFTSDLVTVDDSGNFSLEFIATVMLLDTALIALLIRIFLELSGEDSRTMFIGTRPVFGEVVRGLLFVPVVFVGVGIIVVALRTFLPGLHTVDVNPLSQYMRTPLEASVFIVVVVLGAGIKEELQRAFILRRFEQCLGGTRLGLVISTIVFGALHYTQGWDVAIAVGSLGLFWGVLYVKRRSAVMSMTNHALFDAAQVAQGFLLRVLGG